MIIHRRRTAPVRPTARPLAAVLVALDSAKCTGYATYVNGKLWAFGEVDARSATERARVFGEASQAAYMRQIPIGCVLEVPWGGYQAAALSLHITAYDWRNTWVASGHDGAAMIERTAGQWRRSLFGGRTLGREQARRLEAAYAEQVIARDLGARRLNMPAPGPDAVAAVCIGQTILRLGELARVLGCGCVAANQGG
jgi:hypothetical protein